ncbi:Asp23/Gls24 family envelope stress response protein [Alicyclobacillus cycloheptanicus]|uniref:Alkaline shock family protein YloU n=1 Tax=Alicyclobacillus cycloheptanicus TaxID=1457 RepID=A0ABT9XE60_9BACL|nr:Asp23/Gls24 family envelope stress response protein [Alicyclobacillus cycloheptanicus]MDQ0188359.1 putative alkaline shock family protein YloU [Alicyclobacillus cycloheptanicus]WDM01067.1 Asp23/Gls24 family envelope stress response protein [Alicyclobacillus cycloheptanicus]
MQDMEFQASEMGKIQIADEVLQVIAGLAASEVAGVVGMSGSFAGGLTEQLLGRKNLAKGVKVEFGDGDKECSVDLSVVLDFGVNIPETCMLVQENVKQAIESMTGLHVLAVHVHVGAVAFNQEKLHAKQREVTELLPGDKKSH